jgi:hypothetical protein
LGIFSRGIMRNAGGNSSESPGRKIERIIWFCDEPIEEIRGNYITVSDQESEDFFFWWRKFKKSGCPSKKDPEKLIISPSPSHHIESTGRHSASPGVQ